MTTLKFKRVSASELRKLFNDSGYWARVQSGDLIQRLIENGHPSPPEADEPICTRSQIVEYRTQAGEVVAKVHFYLRKDGRIGASGKPDPKRVLIGDTVYILVGR
jgi:hypothetical protein